MLVHHGEGSGTPTEPHHTPIPEVESSHPTTSSIPLPSIPTAPIPTVTQPDPTPIRQYSRRARIAQSSALLTVADEPASPTSTLPYDSTPRVTSPAADEGSMQQNISELTALCTSLEGVATKPSGEDAPIKGRSNNEGEAVAERIKEKQEKEDMRMNEKIARDVEVARIHAEEEIQGVIDSLDKSNETIAKYLQEYLEFASELPLEKKIELISDLVKYQEHYTK
nr:hypothetical protein [Tanacetum cinerariifolium]